MTGAYDIAAGILIAHFVLTAFRGGKRMFAFEEKGWGAYAVRLLGLAMMAGAVIFGWIIVVSAVGE